MSVGARRFEVLPDQVFLVPPRLRQTFRSGPSKEHHDHIGIHFDWLPRPDSSDFSFFLPGNGPAKEMFFRDFHPVPHWDIEQSPVLDLRGRPRVRALLHEVVSAFAVGGEHSLFLAGALLAAAIAQLGHEAHLVSAIHENPHLGPDAIRCVQRARELLEFPRAKPLSVAAVAAEVGWSADHLGRMCREILGMAPYKIQTAARLRRAQEMLHINHDVAHVAQQCGFDDVSHFCATFKKHTGLTPRQFQRMTRN